MVLKVVIDTSVFVAALLSNIAVSSSYQTIEMWRAGAFTLVTSPQIMRDLVGTLIELDIDQNVIVDLVVIIGKIALRIPGACEVTQLDKVDASDNKVLAAALESHAHFLVSLDKKHILPFKSFSGTQIVTPQAFVRQLI